jgi:kumamolisin
VMTSKIGLVLSFVVLGMISSAQGQTALPYPTPTTPAATDLGELKTLASITPISITVALRLSDVNAAEAMLTAVSTPGNPQFHKFLSAEEAAARFAPSAAEVAKAIAGLAVYGLKAEQVTPTTLKVTGVPAEMERAFSVSLHSYQVAAHGNASSYNYHAPVGSATIPPELAGMVAAVGGLDSRPILRPHMQRVPAGLTRPASQKPATGGGFDAGFLTVADFVTQYDVQPLYDAGVTGAGSTLAIITFASFTPADAFDYWAALGLTVSPSRITIVNIDGGPGGICDACGSDETTLDVEQSGGLAPGANIIVYQAPNTNQGFIDAYAAAVTANAAQTVSSSWGEWEWFDNIDNSPVLDPISGLVVAEMTAVHEQLVLAGIQGQTYFAASGDGGAYDVNHDLGCFPVSFIPCTNVISVDYPASDPAMTGAGGTTLPGVQEYCLNMGCTSLFTINIANEAVWGWDYLRPFCDAIGLNSIYNCGIFPGGGGGGVSVFFGIPSYQSHIPGMMTSALGQSFVQGGIDYFDLPAKFAGRNVPDISANADPQTGYEIFYTSSFFGFEIETFIGGTSFVAPQFNGVSALFVQYLGGRMGLINVPLYQLAASGKAYMKPHAPLHVIGYGDNWFYKGANGYSPAAGLGTLNSYYLAVALKGLGL